MKTSGENEAIYVNYRASRVQCQVCLSIAEAQPIITESNSEFLGGNTGTARFSLYFSPYLVAGQGGKYTKHIYIGSQRIVSKLGDLASYGADPRRIPYAGNEADGVTVDYKAKYSQQLQSIKDNYKAFDQPYNGKDNDDYVNGQVCLKDIVGCTRESLNKLTFLSFTRQFCCNDGTPEAAQARARTRAANGNFKPNDDYEKMQFYYHPDHLDSSSYITNLDGEVSQYIEYVPFGEVFIEERNNTWNTPYLFNAKEFDEETGMYYYGARYYEPRLSLWMSVDRFAEKYYNISPYSFGADNPLISIDINGDSLLVLTAPKGAGGYGHMAILIQTKEKKWALFSKNGTNDWSGSSGENNKGDDKGSSIFNSPKEFLRSSKNPVDSKTKQPEYTEGYLIPATTQQDEAAKRGALEELNKNYNVLGSNCAKTVQNALEKAGKKPGELSYEELKSTPFMNPIGDFVNKIIDRKTPNLIYSRIKKQNKGQTIKR